MTLQDAANISTIFGAIAVIGVFIQAFIAVRQIKADHERSRREKSVELLSDGSKNLKQDNSLARTIVESLNEEESRNLYN